MVGQALIRVPVTEPSQVAEARRVASQAALARRFSEKDVGVAALLATELATNLLKHARAGELLVGDAGCAGGGLDIVAVDSGRGMSDVARCLEDGYSTAGSPGTGLGAVARLASLLEIHSRPDAGTAVFARYVPGRPTGTIQTQVGAVLTAKEGETVCGDGWAAELSGTTARLMFADGLGHGPAACSAVAEAQRVFEATVDLPLEEVTAAIHDALRATRGAAVALADVDGASRAIRFAGLGNVTASIVTRGQRRHMVSMNGTAGHSLLRVRCFDYEVAPPGFVVMHSDGLRNQWDLARYGDLFRTQPVLVASLLWRDARRGNDDAGVLVYRVDAHD